jgi:prepilin-type N-terminal cleavage/methylation domain-containing protein
MRVNCSRLCSRLPRGFTLIEIMVVVVIIGLLAALGIPAFRRAQRASQNTRVVNDFRVFAQAFEIYNTQNGGWPDSAAPGVLPSLPVSIADTLRAASWTVQTTIGGQWQWDNALSSSGDAGICITGFTCTDEQLAEVDAKMDDGNLATGRLKKAAPTRVIYVLAAP